MKKESVFFNLILDFILKFDSRASISFTPELKVKNYLKYYSVLVINYWTSFCLFLWVF